MRTEQIYYALRLGQTAKANNKMRIPWQDKTLIDTMKTHQESVSGNATCNELFEAWLRGWDM
jgi:hypothetical protein